MKISTRGRYALRIMLDLAVNSDGRPVSFRDISDRQGISIKYMEQIGSLLVKAGLITGTRGAQGGYVLVRSPDTVSIGEILSVTEGELMLVPCVDCAFSCENNADCLTAPFWRRFNTLITDYVNGCTLQDLLDRKFDPLVQIEG